MKKMTAIVSTLATALLLITVPAFSAGTASLGFYGPYVPYGGEFGVEQRVEAYPAVVSSGFYGPYVPFGGAYGVERGGESVKSALSGSYGAYGPYLPKGVAEITRDNCLVVATNCPKDILR